MKSTQKKFYFTCQSATRNFKYEFFCVESQNLAILMSLKMIQGAFFIPIKSLTSVYPSVVVLTVCEMEYDSIQWSAYIALFMRVHGKVNEPMKRRCERVLTTLVKTTWRKPYVSFRSGNLSRRERDKDNASKENPEKRKIADQGFLFSIQCSPSIVERSVVHKKFLDIRSTI